MKPSCRIINASRGGVIDEMALVDALNNNIIAGAALDVFEEEKAFSEDHPLRQVHPSKLILTPHLGASTFEAQVNVAVDVAHQIIDCLEDKIPRFAVNVPGLRTSELQKILPLLKLSDKLGSMVVQMFDYPVEQVCVTLKGDFVANKADPIILSALKGVLSATGYLGTVNYVNVKILAENRKIKYSVLKEKDHTKASLKITVFGKDHQTSCEGGLTEFGDVLIKSVGNVPIYMKLPSEKVQLIYSLNKDLPGSIGRITSAIGSHKINIADLHLGRDPERELGMTIASVDSTTKDNIEDLIKEIKSLSEVIDARLFII
eukprot:GHVL01012296.1.p1 GENE.GHVL01012296.1~~GHVL01012296.1.p1  ORF type:complete len:317 (-),score=51.23 GHVL01012296.1:55-1005(-)